MLARKGLFVAVALLVVSLPALAASGVLEFRVRDGLSHQPIQALVKGHGPQSFSISSDSRGKAKVVLPSGDYLLEVSAPGYASLRTHYVVQTGKNTVGGADLDPESVPEEETRGLLDPLLKSDYTLLHEYVVDAKTGDPISGVTVRALNAAVETQTDSKGHFVLSISTPKPENPGGVGTDTVMYQKPGYQTLMLQNLGIAPDEMGPSVVELQRGTGKLNRDATHKLMQQDSGNEPNPQSAIPGSNLSPHIYSWLGTKGSSFPVGAAAAARPTQQTVIVPNSIKVGHNCSVSNNQIVCTSWDPAISLETYVSNGLLGEWLSPWVDDSLKAGSVAYRSYGAWRVAHPLSSNYDICDNALCQVYNPSTFKPTTREKADVSGTSGIVVSSDNVTIFKAEHAAESNLASDTQYATCPDGQVGEPSQGWPCMKDFVDTGKHQAGTHSRGMCQRGSQRWASGKDSTGATGDTDLPILNSDGVPIIPRDWRCILDHYYNANSNSGLVDPNIVSGLGQAGTGLRTAFMQAQPTYGLIAYEATDRNGGLRVANAADGLGDRLLLTAGKWPTWEPGGKRLALYGPTANGGISVINADGTGLTQITNHTNDRAPSWSPLGDKIAFCSDRSGSPEVWMVKPDGTGLQQVTHGLNVSMAGYENEDCYLRWSPDGQYLAFTGVTVSTPTYHSFDVYEMTADGSQIWQRTNCQGSDPSVSVCSTPSFSPDGSKIAFFDGNTFATDTLGGAGLYLIDTSSLAITSVYRQNNAFEEFPQWSTDSRKIIFLGENTLNSSSLYNIWSIDPDGTNLGTVIVTNRSYAPQGALDCSHCANFNK